MSEELGLSIRFIRDCGGKDALLLREHLEAALDELAKDSTE